MASHTEFPERFHVPGTGAAQSRLFRSHALGGHSLLAQTPAFRPAPLPVLHGRAVVPGLLLLDVSLTGIAKLDCAGGVAAVLSGGSLLVRPLANRHTGLQ